MSFLLKSILDVSHALFNIQERISSCLFGTLTAFTLVSWDVSVKTGPEPWDVNMDWHWRYCTCLDPATTIGEEVIQDLEMFASMLISQHVMYIYLYIIHNIYLHIYLYVPSSPTKTKTTGPSHRHQNTSWWCKNSVFSKKNRGETGMSRDFHQQGSEEFGDAYESLDFLPSWIPCMVGMVYWTTQFWVVVFFGCFHVRQINHTFQCLGNWFWEVDLLIDWDSRDPWNHCFFQ